MWQTRLFTTFQQVKMMYGYFFCESSIMKQNINPVTLLSIKKGARIEKTLLKAMWEVVPVKLAASVKRNFPFETYFSKFLRSCSFEVLWVASCERLYNKSLLSRLTKNLMIFAGAHRIVAYADVLQIRCS